MQSLVDDHTRLAYSEILPYEKDATCAAFLQRAITYFAAHGITRIKRLTDNARAHPSSLREVCAQQGIRQRLIKPHCPWQNGKVCERFNRTLRAEWAYRQVFTSKQARTDALAPWLEFYDTQRRHSALGGLPRSAACDQCDDRVHASLRPRRPWRSGAAYRPRRLGLRRSAASWLRRRRRRPGRGALARRVCGRRRSA